jgi:nitrate reductase gamma subunit
VTPPAAAQPTFLRTWLVWTAGFLVFPVAGLAGTAAAGRVDSPAAALLGGLVAGLVLGAGQALVSRRRLDPRRWVPATAVGMSIGLFLGAVTVGYRTTLTDLAVMGAITGINLGVAQAVALPRRTRTRWAWAALMPALWSLGWVVSTLILTTSVDAQFTIFGASGAVTFTALSGLLLHRLLVYRPAADPTPVRVTL